MAFPYDNQGPGAKYMRTKRERTVKVWEVSFTTGPNGEDIGPGPMGDGFRTARFRSEREAKAYALGRMCWGKPATAECSEVPQRIADRWGVG